MRAEWRVNGWMQGRLLSKRSSLHMDVRPGDLTFGLEKNLISHMMLGSIRT